MAQGTVNDGESNAGKMFGRYLRGLSILYARLIDILGLSIWSAPWASSVGTSRDGADDFRI